MTNINQRGFSALPILIILVLGIAVIWETNEYAKEYSKNVSEVSFDLEKAEETQTPKVVCLTGDATDCNDSNDEFILEE